jgi:hypothetical protein
MTNTTYPADSVMHNPDRNNLDRRDPPSDRFDRSARPIANVSRPAGDEVKRSAYADGPLSKTELKGK